MHLIIILTNNLKTYNVNILTVIVQLQVTFNKSRIILE